MFIINENYEIARQEVEQLNEETKHLWTDGITQKLVELYPNQYNDKWAYLVVKGYENYYTDAMLLKAINKLPEDWSNEIEEL